MKNTQVMIIKCVFLLALIMPIQPREIRTMLNSQDLNKNGIQVKQGIQKHIEKNVNLNESETARMLKEAFGRTGGRKYVTETADDSRRTSPGYSPGVGHVKSIIAGPNA